MKPLQETREQGVKSWLLEQHFLPETKKVVPADRTDVNKLQNSIWEFTPPKSQATRDAELLDRHMKQYHELMKVQPKRHTEQQLAAERSKQREMRAIEQQRELEVLRGQKAHQVRKKAVW